MYINSIPADVRTPDEEAIRQQRADFMREKVALLKGRYRRLIELRYFDEFSYEENRRYPGYSSGDGESSIVPGSGTTLEYFTAYRDC